MTSAARPTFLPAMGGYSLRDTHAGPITLKGAKDITAHTKMKFRKRGQGTKEDLEAMDLKKLLLEREQAYKTKTMMAADPNAMLSLKLNEKFKEIENLDRDSEDDQEQDDKDSDEDSEEEDDTAELMRELAKIKEERLQQQQDIENEKQAEQEKLMQQRAMTGNPLLADSTTDGSVNGSETSSFVVKRRWDDDVVFKNQSRGVQETPKKKFVNDMLRSDFHRRFMSNHLAERHVVVSDLASPQYKIYMSGIFEMIIGKRMTPEEQVKKWRSQVRVQERELDKTVRGIEQEQAKAKKLVKQAAKRGDMKSCRILAREIVKSGRARERVIVSKAQLNSLVMQMQQQVAIAKVTGVLQKSTDIMRIVNKLIKLPEMAATMETLSMEMMKEMVNDTLEEHEDDLEEEAEEEVEKVLFELTNGILGQAGAVGSDFEAEEVQEKGQDDQMEARMRALNSV